jgi:serine/threonine protein kinase
MSTVIQNQSQNIQNETQSNTPKYELKKLTLGKGTFSEVKLAIHSKTKQQVAAKIIDILEWNKEFKNEVNILQNLSHQNVISFLGSEIRRGGRGVIYLEYLTYPTLSYHLKNYSTLSEELAIKVLTQMVDTVYYLQSKGISHHDLKPDNMIYDPEKQHIKLFDFGLAISVNPENPISRSRSGSPLYMAPEILLKDSHNVFQADIWSIGICLYEILSGKTPFQNCETKQELENEWRLRKDISLPAFLCSTKLRILYSQTIKYEPERRITIQELKNILSAKKSLIASLAPTIVDKPKRIRSSSVQSAIIRKAKPKRNAKRSGIPSTSKKPSKHQQ